MTFAHFFPGCRWILYTFITHESGFDLIAECEGDGGAYFVGHDLDSGPGGGDEGERCWGGGQEGEDGVDYLVDAD